MEEQIAVLFSQELLQEAANLFGMDSINAKKLGDFENYVFEVYDEGKPYILRLTHSSHRNEIQVNAELEWIHFLKENQISIPNPYRSVNGKLVESLHVKDSSFYISLFEKAPGHQVSVLSEEFNERLFYIWGKTIGKMHQVTKKFPIPDYLSKRPEWFEEELLNVEKFVADDESGIIKNTKKLVTEINRLPQSAEDYGLIHSDIHSGNFFYDGEQIYVFDFDDCSYHWFISDIAIPLYYSAWYKYQDGTKEERSIFAQEFLTHFLRGYYEENQIDSQWIEKIPLFLRLRDITLYAVFLKKLDMENLTPKMVNLIEAIKQRIINEEEIVDINYQAVINILT